MSEAVKSLDERDGKNIGEKNLPNQAKSC